MSTIVILSTFGIMPIYNDGTEFLALLDKLLHKWFITNLVPTKSRWQAILEQFEDGCFRQTSN